MGNGCSHAAASEPRPRPVRIPLNSGGTRLAPPLEAPPSESSVHKPNVRSRGMSEDRSRGGGTPDDLYLLPSSDWSVFSGGLSGGLGGGLAQTSSGRLEAPSASSLLRDLVAALAEPAAFTARAAALLAAALPGASRVELRAFDGPRLPLLAACPAAEPEEGAELGAPLASALPRILASAEPLPLPGRPGAFATRAAVPGDGGAAAVGLVAASFDGGKPPGHGDLVLLAQASDLVAVGIAAARASPLEAMARALRPPAAPDALDRCADAARLALRADRCLVLAAPAAGEAGPPSVRGASPPEAKGWALPEGAWRELAAGRPVRAAVLLAEPVRSTSGRVVGALAASAAGGRAWSDADAEAAAACAWALSAALSPPETGAGHKDLERELRERELMGRLANEISACSGVQAAFDCCAELLCRHFDATRVAMYDFSQPRAGGLLVPRTFFAFPGSAPTGADDSGGVPLDEEMVKFTLELCEGSPHGVFLRNGFEGLPPAIRKYSAPSCIVAPARHEGTVIAVIAVEKTDEAARWGEEERRFTRLVSAQIGFALAQSALREQVAAQNAALRREVRDSELLESVVREIALEADGSVGRIFARSAELVGRALQVDRCALWRYYDNGQREAVGAPEVVWVRHAGIPHSKAGFDADATRKMWGLLRASEDQVLMVPDLEAQAKTLFADNPQALRTAQALAAKSLMSTAGYFRGDIMSVISVEMVERKAEWGPAERRLLRKVADRISMAIAHARLLERERAHAAQLERQLQFGGLLQAMTKEIHQVLGVKEVFQRAAVLVRQSFRASRVRVTSLEEMGLEALDTDPAVEGYNLSINNIDESLGEGAKDSLGALMLRLGAQGRRVYSINDVSDEGELARLGLGGGPTAQELFRRQHMKSLAFAFTSFDGKVNGLIGVTEMVSHRVWKEDELRLLETVAEQIGVAIAQSRLLRAETEQRELLAAQNAALEAARREADAASTAKSQFLAMVSHEIRTPMNALCNMSEMLLDTELTTQQRDFCTIIHNSSLALLNILKDILDTSRLEFNKVEIRRGPVALRDLVEQVAELMFPSAAQKGIDLAWHVARDCPAVLHTDGARLNQILFNTLGNGIKFTSKGEVSLTARLEGGQLLLAVRDTGIGISAEDQKKLFSWFSQVDSSHTRQYGGTGLGLFISRKLARLLGGDLRCESEPGRGSSFRLTLPLDGAEAAPEPLPGPVPLAGRRVAVWSPSPATRALLLDALEAAGAAPAPLEAAPSGPFDACVVDTAGGGPPELPAGLRAVPRVALVARGAAGVGPAADGAAALVAKPARPRALVEALAGALAGRPAPPLGPALSTSLASSRGALGLQGGGQRSRSADTLPLGHVPPPDGAPLRILVAEDVDVNRKILLLMLRKRGYAHVEAAGNGAEALAAVHAAAAAGRPFHLLFMDVMMPVMDGLTAARRIRAEVPEALQPYIVALTANAMAGDREACLAVMRDYVPKPVRTEALAAALARCEAALRPGGGTSLAAVL